MEMNILGKIAMFTKEGCFLVYNIYDLGPEKVFTVHSRGVFTQDKSDYISNSKVYRKKWDREKVFTNQGCSLIRGVHYERFHCTLLIYT